MRLIRTSLMAWLLAMLGVVQFAEAAETPAQLATEAVGVLDEIMRAPDSALPKDMLRNAYAVAVVPNVIKAGLVFGGRHGEGLISVKKDGTWSNPSFIKLTGGSIGFQIGVSSTDLLLIFRSERGVDSIIYGKFMLGTDAAVAAGPVGRNAQASTDAQLRAEIYAYSHAKGLFLGLSLQGSSLRMNDAANHAAYGEGVSPKQIFAGEVEAVPASIVHFRDQLEEYTAP